MKKHTNQESQDLFLNPFRVATSKMGRSFIDEAILLCSNYEKYFQLRKRRRDMAGQVLWKRQLEAILSDVACRPKRAIAISLSKGVLGKKDRYKAPILNEGIRDVLSILSSPEMGYISVSKGIHSPFGKGSLSTIKAAFRVKDRLKSLGLTEADFGISGDQEVIILKRAKEFFNDEKAPIQYQDTPFTNKARAELKQINDFLVKADIQVSGYEVEVSDRALRRVFNSASFEQGGRLFGGFWQGMSKRSRLEGILINGEEVVELDYDNMAPTILYGLAGEVAPLDVDSYVIPTLRIFDSSKSPLDYRGAIKMLFNAMLHSPKPLSKLPKGLKPQLRGISYQNVGELERLIKAHNKPIAKFLNAGKGLAIFHKESSVMVEALLTLNAKKIVALPIHDSVIVAKSKAKRAKKIMEEAFIKVVGIKPIISEVA